MSFFLLIYTLGYTIGGMKRIIKDSEKKEISNVKKEILEWLEIIVIAAVIAFCLNTFIIANSTVPTGSMVPTINVGSRVIGSRLAYLGDKAPERGDIIIFKWPDNEKVLFVKRVIGLPGDTIDIINGQVYLNGSSEPLDESAYIREPMDPYEEPMHFEVPEDCYFCMGDNRNESMDARYWQNTFVHKDKILAKVLFRYWPLPIKKVE